MKFWGALPDYFRAGTPTWMCVSAQCDSSFMGYGLQDSDYDITRELWDNIWSWRFNGTTSYTQWDKRLVKLAETAGVCGIFQETALDSEAASKGWTKVKSKQPVMASYKKDGVRLNFYLTTGTVGSSLDHTVKGKTQLFRREVVDFSALFDNPRTHTGKSYYTLKKKKKKKDHEVLYTAMMMQRMYASLEAEGRKARYYIDEEQWPDPCDNAQWKSLVQYPQLKYLVDIPNESLYCGLIKDNDEITAHSANKLAMNQGSPKWVFQTKLIEISRLDRRSMNTYMKSKAIREILEDYIES